MRKVLIGALLLLVLYWVTACRPEPESFSFVVLSDANSRAAPVYAKIASLDPRPAFVLQIGDLGHGNPARRIGEYNDPIEAWRSSYDNMLYTSKHGQDWQAYIVPNFPVYHIWDDHDYGDQAAHGTASWKQVSRQAFLEFFPDQPYADPNSGLYFTFSRGPAQFFVLDTRSERSPYREANGPAKTMLGSPQLQWLKEGLLDSVARWKFIVSSVPWNPTVSKLDAWHGFRYEAEVIKDFIETNDIAGVIFISGDIHSGGAIDDGTNSGFPEISVPHTNLKGGWSRPCKANFCGLWSEGIAPGRIVHEGYALITVTPNRVTLQTWAKGEMTLVKSLVVDK